MHKVTLLLLAAVIAAAFAEGQFYVPRAYYTIDAEGHESLPVPLRRLRRSLPQGKYPWNQGGGGGAGAGACMCTCTCPVAGSNAGSGAGGAGAAAGAGAGAIGGGDLPYYPLPTGIYGSSNPNAKTLTQSGSVNGGKMVSASSAVGIGPNGTGFYQNRASVGH